jgi:hypothetical protein
MKTYTRYMLAVAMMFAIAMVAAGTVTAAEQPIYHNFVNDTMHAGTLPSDSVRLANTAPIWQAQLDSFHNDSMMSQDDQKAVPVALDGIKPLWCTQVKCL